MSTIGLEGLLGSAATNGSRTRARLRAAALAALSALLFSSPAYSVNVSVIDTGVDYNQPPLPGRIAPGGYDFAEDDADPYDPYVDPKCQCKHGTIVSAIIIYTADSYNANAVDILPFKIWKDNGDPGFTSSYTVTHDRLVAADAKVVNMSFGFEGYPAQFVQIMQDMIRSGKVLIISAGNDGGAEPSQPAKLVNELGGAAIAVGAIDPRTGLIADYSNRAGSAMNFYLVADGTWYGLQGTSISAPRVSAAAALLIAAAPNLTPQQVVDILLKSATDMGAPGVDPIYGWGRLNIEAALAPQGGMNVPTGGSGGGGGGAGAGLALAAVGAAGAYAIMHKNKKVEETVAVDAYNRPYVVDLNDWFEVNEYVPSLTRIFENLGQDFGFIRADVGSTATLGVQYTRARDWDVSPLAFVNPDTVAGEPIDVSMDLRGGDAAGGLYYALSTNSDPVGTLGALSFVEEAGSGFLSGNALSMPFLGFADRADSARVGFRFDDQVGVAATVIDTRDAGPFGLTSRSGMIEGSYRINDRAAVKVQLGELIEQGGFFGGSPGSVLGVDEARTTAAGVSASLRLDRRWTMVAQYAYGLTDVDETELSLLDQFSELRSDAWGLGLVGNEVWSRGDSAGIAVSRPLRIASGEADLTVPTSVDLAGNVFFETDRVSLAPEGSELDVELFYRRPLGRSVEVGAYLLHQREPAHASHLDSRTTAFGMLRARF